MVLTDVSEKECERIAKRIAAGFREKVKDMKNPPTLSIGFCVFGSSEIIESLERFWKKLEKTDIRLLFAKESGKNCLCNNAGEIISL